MIKIYCDACGKEIDENYIGGKLIKRMVLGGKEIVVTVNACFPVYGFGGHLCLECLLRVVNDGMEE